MSPALSLPPCPRCGSADVRRSDNGGLVCNACSARFEADEPQGSTAIDASAAATPQETDAHGLWWRVWPVAALLGLGALSLIVAWWSAGGPQLHADNPESDAPSPLQAEVQGVIRAPFGPDGVYWLFDYVNTGSLPIASPTAELAFFDAQERVISQERVGVVAPDRLDPGEQVAMQIRVPDAPDHAFVKLMPVPPTQAESPSQLRPLWTREVGLDAQGLLHGLVRGPEGMRFEVVVISVVGRREDGAPVAFGDASVEGGVVEGGTWQPFTVNPNDLLQAMKPTVWTAQAWGRPIP